MNAALFVPPDAAPGRYHLQMMLYHDESLEPILTTDGQSIVELLQLPVSGLE